MPDPKRPEFTPEQLQEVRRLQGLYPDRHELFRRNLPERGAIKVQEFADAPLGALNSAVQLVGVHTDKTR